ncbi:MAG: tRNA pseudouridine(55) synthase TruB [candidate division WOR-3 bacterium]|nr:tRNA pseudouridine(55) synthase TruB [candidate division WOR-3 bacterium]MCX7947422.1 tRNA pseudouridine(55) synthase TruB [candidate division WOR-3 bacterium]MDW8151180.1 tRNA pseudouridine(55) synthase TruB [candidate division WOR-3 bacterium]
MNGFILINKPKGYTSYDVIRVLKKILGFKKIGHSGTLDPFAEGLLVIGINKATKFIEFLIGLEKTYIAKIKFGIETNTLDVEGDIINVDSSFKLNISVFQKVIEDFPREYEQIPPKFSAKRIHGKRAYELSREGIDFEIKPKTVKIYELKVLSVYEVNNEADIFLRVSSGFYVRSFARDLAEKLNTYGYVLELKRIAIGSFKLENAHSLNDSEFKVISIDEALYFFEKIEIIDCFKFKSGQITRYKYKEGIYRVYCDGNFIGVGKIENELLKPLKVL